MALLLGCSSAGPHARTDRADAGDAIDAASPAGPDSGDSRDAWTGDDGGTFVDASLDADASTAGACNKRGLAYGHHSTADLRAMSRAISWWYNWSQKPEDAVKGDYASIGVEFVPMVWGGTFDVDKALAAIPDDAKYLLAFNEPNFNAQANLTAEQAAALWPKLEQVAKAKKLKIPSPAVNYCGGGCNQTDPFKYLDAFFAACKGCQVDYVAAHWYACTANALQHYLSGLKKYNKPIWLTEFSCGDGKDRSLAAQKQYMTEAVAILEREPDVFRYAWFSGRTSAIPNVDVLGEDGVLTELGMLYASLPRAEGCQP